MGMRLALLMAVRVLGMRAVVSRAGHGARIGEQGTRQRAYAWRMLADCPQHAQPVAQVESLRGACSATYVKGALARALGLPDEAEVAIVVEGESGNLVALGADGARSPITIEPALGSPCAVASDDEALLIVERDPARVRILHGAKQFTLGEGLLIAPVAVAADGSLVAVADEALAQVLVFDLATDDDAVVEYAPGYQPAGVAFDDDGALWWTDATDHCVHRWVLGPEGTDTRFGERGAFPGQFTQPRGIACRAGCVFIADHLNHRIAVLNGSDGAMVGWWGMHAVIPRQGKGRIHYPDTVALRSDGKRAVVTEAFEDRVQVLEPGGPAPVNDGLSVPRDSVSSHFGADASALGPMLAMTEPETGSVVIFNLAGQTPAPAHITTIGGSAANPGRFPDVSSVCVVPDECVVVADRRHARLDLYRVKPDRTGPIGFDPFLPKLVRSVDVRVATGAVGPMSLDDIAFDGTRLLALDSANRCIWVLDRRLRQAQPPERIDLPPDARTPVQLAASPLWWALSDPDGGGVWLRSSLGTWIRLAWPDAVGEAPANAQPFGVAFADDGTLLIVDRARDQATFLSIDADGAATVVACVGQQGGGDGDFWFPHGATALRDGFLVVDRGNHRFQAFGGDGAWRFTGSLGKFSQRKRGAPRQNELPSVAAPRPAEQPPSAPGGDS